MQSSPQIFPSLDSVKIFHDFYEFDRWLHSKSKMMYFSEYYKIFISHTRSLRIFVDDKLYDVGDRNILIANHMEYYKVLSQDSPVCDGIVIVFNPAYIEESNTANTNLTACFTKRSTHFSHLRSLTAEQAAQFDQLVACISDCTHSPEYGDDVQKKISLIEMLVLINRIYQEPGRMQLKPSSMSYQKTKPIIDYINANIHMKLTLEELSQRFFISKYHLCRIFKESTGHTVNEYITFRRISKACELLRDGASIIQASETVGMETSSHFISVFKRIMGTTPKKYANKYKMK